MSSIGYKHTNEAKEKIRKAMSNRVISDETKKRLSLANKGNKLTAEQRDKLSKALKGRTPPNKGKKASAETKEKIRKAKTGVSNKCKGVPLSEEHKLKLSLAKLGKTGVNSNGYKNGSSRNKHSLTTPAYREWRVKVFSSDNYRCRLCSRAGYLEAHHIKSWANFPELRFDENNGMTLCVDCHCLVDKQRARFNKTKK